MNVDTAVGAVLEGGLEVRGSIHKVTFCNRESGWAIVKVRVAKEFFSAAYCDKGGLATMVGKVGGIPVGEPITARCRIEQHPRFGAQLGVISFTIPEVKGNFGLVHFLSKRVPHINNVLATRIVEAFGDDTFRVMDEQPERLREVRGIGKTRVESILSEWPAIKQHRDVLVFLSNAGIGPHLTEAVMERFKGDVVKIITEDPYKLTMVDGIGFATADAVAMKCGMTEMDPRRLTAAVSHAILESSILNGHIFVYGRDLVGLVTKLLDTPQVTSDAIMGAVSMGVEQGRLVIEDNRVYTASAHAREVDVATRLRAMLANPVVRSEEEVDRAMKAAIAAFLPMVPDDRQIDAIRKCLTSRVSVVTGSAGTGKTAVTKAIITGLMAIGRRVSLTAPTGKASMVLAEATGMPAMTIHRRIGFGPNAKHGDGDGSPTGYGDLLVDEMSMVDLQLFGMILQFLPGDAALIMIGDHNQLPSVGAGAVLRDILASGTVPTTRLTKIFRQAESSDIVVNANGIIGNHTSGIPGIMLRQNLIGRRHGPIDISRDMHIYPLEDNSQQVLATVWAATSWGRSLGFDPVRDTQVMSLMYKGESGIDALNTALQQAINPTPVESFARNGEQWGVGDKVIQTKNDYDLGIFNGETGIISGLVRNEGGEVTGIVVDFVSGTQVEIPIQKAGRLRLAYAASIHRCQGSQNRFVIVVMSMSQYMMLNRNILYTAITRGQKRVLLITSPDAMNVALRKEDTSRRNTWLCERLGER